MDNAGVVPYDCGHAVFQLLAKPESSFSKVYGMSDSHLRLGHVSKTFRVGNQSLQALQGVDLRIASAEFVTIVGASGCGKSTLLRIIAGLETRFDGEIRHDGRPIEGPSLDRGIVFQEPRLFPWLTVEQNVALGLENAPLDAAAKRRVTAEHIALVGLAGFEKAYPRQLSGGMAQRVAIARSLVNRPDILLLDEGHAPSIRWRRAPSRPRGGCWCRGRSRPSCRAGLSRR